MFAKNLKKHFKGLSSRFAEFHPKCDADTLLEFVSHCDNYRAVLTQGHKTTCTTLTHTVMMSSGRHTQHT